MEQEEKGISKLPLYSELRPHHGHRVGRKQGEGLPGTCTTWVNLMCKEGRGRASFVLGENWFNSAGRELALQVADPGWVFTIPYGPPSITRIPECGNL